ncbi:hypothetical protein YC2023_098810 [Brassica napus]
MIKTFAMFQELIKTQNKSTIDAIVMLKTFLIKKFISNDVPLGSVPGKPGMHGLITGISKDICSLFDSYLPNHEASTHEITWRMFLTQLWSS